VKGSWRLRPTGRWPSRVGGALGAAVLVIAMSPAASGAAVQQAAPAPATPAQHLAWLAKYGQRYLDRVEGRGVERLSGAGRTLIKFAQDADKLQRLAANSPAALARQATRAQGPRAARAGFANDTFAAEDFFSRLTGMTQNGPSVGWCGANAVVGFTDSGSIVSTLFLAQSPSASVSIDGFARSTNAGASYTDMGAVIADPIPEDLLFRDLLGDPIVGCTSSRNFYYASLGFDTGPDFAFGNSTVTVSPSTDGGATFQPAIVAAAKDANFHVIDKAWMAVAPGASSAATDDVIHVVYTDVDFTGFGGGGSCNEQVRFALEYVRSTDGGQNWSEEPLVLDEACEVDAFVQAPQVETGTGNTVYVAWERSSPNGAERELRIRRSANGGDTFGATSTVGPVTAIGDSFAVQGLLRANLNLQGLAVDRSGGSRRGTIYVTFQDGSARQKPDPTGFCNATPTYCFGDVYITRSSNGGATWSTPVRINNDDITLGIDQWFPAVEVDRSGAVWATYYDRRRDERNFLMDTFVARSTNGGATWTNTRATKQNFAPVSAFQDLFLNPTFAGDHLWIAADTTGSRPGVIAAWGDWGLGDANIVQRKYEG
jgi:hypothetical protein